MKPRPDYFDELHEGINTPLLENLVGFITDFKFSKFIRLKLTKISTNHRARILLSKKRKYDVK